MNTLDVKKGKQVSFNKLTDYIIGIDNVKVRGHLHNMIWKTGYNPLAHCEKSYNSSTIRLLYNSSIIIISNFLDTKDLL
jgi:hypothetical protein